MCATLPCVALVTAKPRTAAAVRSTNSRSDIRLFEGRHAPHGLARDAERLATGRQQGQAPRGAQQVMRDLGAGVDQVLAVVEDQQQVAKAQRGAQRVAKILTWLFMDAEGRGNRLGNTLRASKRGASSTSHTPSANVEGEIRGDFQRQPRLAHAAGARQGHQPRRFAQQLSDFGALGFAADEAGELRWQVVGRRSWSVERAPKWERCRLSHGALSLPRERACVYRRAVLPLNVSPGSQKYARPCPRKCRLALRPSDPATRTPASTW